MAKNKMKVCKHCGAEIAKSAKVCPNCGGKNPKPIYQRVWFWFLIVVVVFGLLSGGGKDSEEPSPENIEYTAVTVDEMFKELKANAVNAEEKYNEAYLEVTGRLSVIDSDGQYIALSELNDEWSFNDVQCFIKSDEQLDKVKKMTIGDTVTVKGKITEVGEVLGYQLYIDSIE